VSDGKKKGAPTRIGDAVASFIREHGLTERIERAQILIDWNSLVGPQIAGVTVPRTVTEDGTLFVGVKTHGWMQELSMRERELLARINVKPGRPAVKKIRWELLR